jgi:protein-tyrosine phosphatase
MLMRLGTEMFYGTMALEGMQHGKAATMADSDYVLVEFYPDTSYNEIEKGLRNVIHAGYRPILAHVERYMCLERETDLVEDLIRQGVYIQVNARSFLRKRFDKRGKWVRTLLKNELIHFVATDCHNSGSRAPLMAAAVEKMLTLTDEKHVDELVFGNAVKLLKNQII